MEDSVAIHKGSKNQKYHLTQQSHYWVYIQRIIKHSTIKTHAREYSLQHCSQQQRHGINLNAHQWQTDKKNVYIYIMEY